MSGSRWRSDFLVVGSGLSGLFLAWKLARLGTVHVMTKKAKTDSNSSNAQGGIAAVMSGEDSIEKHIRDTIEAGDGLCNDKVVRTIIEQGPACVQELVDMGVPFSKNEDGSFDLGREGGHSLRRVLHAGDITGNEIQHTLLQVVERECPDVTIVENLIAVNLATDHGTCTGLHALDQESGEIVSLEAGYTVLATGGAGKVYLFTSNPDIATGDGIAMAYRAGARVANMEFFQFHPTCLYHPYAKSFLISEALRGEGARLINHEGERFMFKYHPDGELAPRDIVSRGIDQEMKEHGLDCVYLDIASVRSPGFIIERFPRIHEKCQSLGIDITSKPVPVVPAAHYTCGGVLANVDGTTNIKGLLAIGETSCTGFHGANRLASNSLLECVVMADQASKYLAREMGATPRPVRPWNPGTARQSKEAVVVKHDWDEVRSTMWNYVGIVRSMRSLTRARARIDNVMAEIKDYYWEYLLTSDLVELRHVTQVADIIITSAMARLESRGTHYMVDHPGKLKHPVDTLITRPDA